MTSLTRSEREWRIERLLLIGGGQHRFGRMTGNDLVQAQRARITLPTLSILKPADEKAAALKAWRKRGRPRK